jgi:DNA-binding transcriptional LysR family regulator
LQKTVQVLHESIFTFRPLFRRSCPQRQPATRRRKIAYLPSAINRQILQAEAFGTPLFERLPEGLRMTTAGELLYDNLLRWRKEFQLTRQKFDELQGLKRGTVSVGMVQALAEGVCQRAGRYY